jgi:hypothetical protein
LAKGRIFLFPISLMNTALKLKLFGLSCLTFIGGTVFGIYLVSIHMDWFVPELVAK